MDIALFSPAALFGADDSDDDNSRETGKRGARERQQEEELQSYVERSHAFPGGVDIRIREFSFHQLNANLLWPGTFAFSEWLLQNSSVLQGKRVLELGSGTGALAIFLQKTLEVDITTSDYDDAEIEQNITYNCRANGLDALPHIRHTWGESFPVKKPAWNLIIASDILLYVKQYPNLVKTVSFLLKAYKPMVENTRMDNHKVERASIMTGSEDQSQCPMFLMSWRRRIGREDESLFFSGCEAAGLLVEHLGSRVYSIVPGNGS